MVRSYKRKLGARKYKNYSDSSLLESVADISNGMSYRKSSEKHGIPFKSIQNKITQKHSLKHGGQTELTAEQESGLVAVILAASEWGYPLTKKDIRLLVKNYLDENKMTCKKFKNNLPGNDWCSGFLNRHSQLSTRKCQNTLVF
jgi:hypothetical protein